MIFLHSTKDSNLFHSKTTFEKKVNCFTTSTIVSKKFLNHSSMTMSKKNSLTSKLHENKFFVKISIIILMFVLIQTRDDFDCVSFELTLKMIFIE